MRNVATAFVAAMLMTAGAVAGPALAKTAAPAGSAAKAPAGRTPAQMAASARMKDCGAQWQAMKAQGKTANTTWTQFSKTCQAKAKG